MRKGIIQVITSNIIYFVIGVLSSLILPKFLSMGTYSSLKTYTLYLSYAGLLTLGYVDGILLKYGGKDIEKISNEEYYNNLNNFVFIEVIIAFFSIIVSVFVKDIVFLFFSLAIVFENILWYYRTFFQAVGKFSDYGKILNLQKVVLLLVELIAIFALKMDNEKVYLSITVLIAIGTAIYFTYSINKKFFKFVKTKFNKKIIFENIKSGITLTLGNLANTFFTGIDRWFVKILLSTADFALYAFAVSLENIVNLFITPISVSLYNFICKNLDEEYLMKLKKVTALWGIIIISAAFPAKFVLEKFLIDYIDASHIIFYLFATQAFYVIIKGIYLNIYKATKKQKKYLKQTIIMIIIAILLNIILFQIKPNMNSFAVGTFITAIIWFAICEFGANKIKFSLKENIYIIMEIAIFLIAGFYFNSIFGFAVYIVCTIILSFILMRDTVKYLFKIVFEIITNKIRKLQNIK